MLLLVYLQQEWQVLHRQHLQQLLIKVYQFEQLALKSAVNLSLQKSFDHKEGYEDFLDQFASFQNQLQNKVISTLYQIAYLLPHQHRCLFLWPLQLLLHLLYQLFQKLQLLTFQLPRHCLPRYLQLV